MAGKKKTASHGGKRKGAGRKKGGENKKTKEERLEAEIMRERVVARVDEVLDPLLDAQISDAMGVQYLFRIDYVTEEYKDPKTGKLKKRQKQKKAVQVTDPEEIKDYIMGKVKNKNCYHFITTQRPNSKAADSLIDRAIGKATQPIDNTHTFKSMGDILDEAEAED